MKITPTQSISTIVIKISVNDKFLQLFSCQKLVLPEGLLAGMHGFFAEKNNASVREIFIASPPEKVFIPDEENNKKKCEKKTRFFRY